MKHLLRLLLVVLCTWSIFQQQAKAQATYQLEIDSIVGIPDTIFDGQEVTFYLIVSMNSALFYQGDVFVELEYGGSFYQVDTSIAANGFLGPNSPNTIQAMHRFSTDDDLQIGDNVVVVWPRIGDGLNPPQEVTNPFTAVITMAEPMGLEPASSTRIRESFISPNPAISSIDYQLKPSEKVVEAVLYSITGQVLYRSSQTENINISRLSAGIYFVDVLTESGNIYYDKLLITR
jgi:hypothetical protein